MKRKVKPSGIKGLVKAPPSKSFAQRAIALAAMAEGRSQILFPGQSDDAVVARNVAVQLGAKVEKSGDSLYISGGINVPTEPLDCGEAGLSIRMFSSIASVFKEPVTLTGKGSLLKRPMGVVEESLNAMGVKCNTSGGYLPVTVCGPLKGGVVRVDGRFSSQVITGMLIAAPYAENDLTIRVENLKSRPYIDITLSVMKSFGVETENREYSEFFVRSGQRYRPIRYMVEGDWSAASFLLVAGAIGGEVTVQNIDSMSPQADKAILKALEAAGAEIYVGDKEVSVNKSPLKGFIFDATHCPDLFPPLVSLASYSTGETRIKGVGRLIHKESNRAATLKEEFGKMGITVAIEGDEMVIEGGTCRGGSVFSHGDHRIAMACAIVALNSEREVEIEGAEAVAKSYPDFFKDLERLMV